MNRLHVCKWLLRVAIGQRIHQELAIEASCPMHFGCCLLLEPKPHCELPQLAQPIARPPERPHVPPPHAGRQRKSAPRLALTCRLAKMWLPKPLSGRNGHPLQPEAAALREPFANPAHGQRLGCRPRHRIQRPRATLESMPCPPNAAPNNPSRHQRQAMSTLRTPMPANWRVHHGFRRDDGCLQRGDEKGLRETCEHYDSACFYRRPP